MIQIIIGEKKATYIPSYLHYFKPKRFERAKLSIHSRVSNSSNSPKSKILAVLVQPQPLTTPCTNRIGMFFLFLSVISRVMGHTLVAGRVVQVGIGEHV